MAIVDGFVDRVADRKTERMGALLVTTFHLVNDRFGHDDGDKALKLSQIIKGGAYFASGSRGAPVSPFEATSASSIWASSTSCITPRTCRPAGIESRTSTVLTEAETLKGNNGSPGAHCKPIGATTLPAGITCAFLCCVHAWIGGPKFRRASVLLLDLVESCSDGVDQSGC